MMSMVRLSASSFAREATTSHVTHDNDVDIASMAPPVKKALFSARVWAAARRRSCESSSQQWL